MFKYKDMLCPVCHQKLNEDDTAICPDCGAPHHKQCYLEIGHCFFKEDHGTANQWKMPNSEEVEDENIETKCTNCGHELQPEDNFCPNCRKPVGQPNTNQLGGNTTNQSNNNGTQINPFFIRNGIDQDEIIDGEKVSDIASFVGYNALRYIRIFRKFDQFKSKISWNWVAFLFPDCWLFSRKCYKAGFIAGFVRVFISVMMSIGGIDDIYSAMISTSSLSASITPQTSIMIIVLGVISLLLMIIVAMFGDYIYKRNVYYTLDLLHKNNIHDEITYMRAGGVNLFLALLSYWGVSLISIIIINFIL